MSLDEFDEPEEDGSGDEEDIEDRGDGEEELSYVC